MDIPKKKVEYLVVDTSAFIKNAPLHEIAENLLTVPEVVNEIKSKRQLRRLAVLPYDLVVKDTFPEHVAFVSEFSKKTGDYPSLSAADIQVIALTYQLEKEKVGIDHLNRAPVQKQPIIEATSLSSDVKNVVGFYAPKKKKSLSVSSSSNCHNTEDVVHNEHDENNEDSESEESVYDSAEDGEFNETDNLVSDIVCNEILKKIDNSVDLSDSSNNEENENDGDDDDDDDDANGDGGEGEDDDVDVDVDVGNVGFGVGVPVGVDDDGNSKNNEDDDDDDDDDDGGDDDDDDIGWITPENIKTVKNQMSQDIVEDARGTVVACLTTDFAMQNVLKQIGLKVVTLDGKLIKKLRTYILRCYGCFKTTSVMTHVFCPNCGNKTLKRVSVTLNPDGTHKLYINFRRPLTARGKKFSLPTFKGGKHSTNPILSADQPMPQQRISKMSRQKNNPLDDDFIAGFSPFVMRDVTSKSAMLGLRPQTEMKHWMRKNPNEARPNRRKNKKYN